MKNKAENKLKALPKFKSEREERAFWARHSPLDYFPIQNASRAVFPNLRPTTQSISIRLPEGMLETLKVLAHKRDVPYQSLAKLLLARQLQVETAGAGHVK